MVKILIMAIYAEPLEEENTIVIIEIFASYFVATNFDFTTFFIFGGCTLFLQLGCFLFRYV